MHVKDKTDEEVLGGGGGVVFTIRMWRGYCSRQAVTTGKNFQT